jgi:hypothetical protein
MGIILVVNSINVKEIPSNPIYIVGLKKFKELKKGKINDCNN